MSHLSPLARALFGAAVLTISVSSAVLAQPIDPDKPSAAAPLVNPRHATSILDPKPAAATLTGARAPAGKQPESDELRSGFEVKRAAAEVTRVGDDDRQVRGDDALVTLALEYLGRPYRFGGTTPAGFDCSGFTQFVYGKVGVALPRSSDEQAAAGIKVDPKALRPGDLLVFQNTYRAGPSHTGIYLGDGRFIHANNAQTGVTITSMSDAYWASRLYTVRRS